MIPLSGGSIARMHSLIGTFKPELTILYTAPVDTDNGTFSFSVDNYTANESPADGLNTVTVTVNRIGGSDGAATVNWAARRRAPGTLADITGAYLGFGHVCRWRAVRDIYRCHQQRCVRWNVMRH